MIAENLINHKLNMNYVKGYLIKCDEPGVSAHRGTGLFLIFALAAPPQK